MRSACRASMFSDLSNRSRALSPRNRAGSMTVAKCAPIPLFASGRPKMACSSAIRMSQAGASSDPRHGRSVDCGDDRFVGFVDHLEHEPFLRRHEIDEALAGLVRLPPRLEISAPAKSPFTGARDHNGTDFRVGTRVDEGLDQRRHEFRRQSVRAMRSIECEQANVATVFDDQVLRVYSWRSLLRFLGYAQDVSPSALLGGPLSPVQAEATRGRANLPMRSIAGRPSRQDAAEVAQMCAA